MHFPPLLILAALSAGSVTARPSSHHRHQQFHEQNKRALGDMVVAVIDGETVSWTNNWSGEPTAAPAPSGVSPPVVDVVTSSSTPSSTPTPTPTPTPSTSSSAPVVSSTESSTPESSSTGSSTYVPFCSASKDKRATAAEIGYKGNTGNCGWGSNMQLVDAAVADQYTYAAKFTGDNSGSLDCGCWNKIGPDGGINGWFGHRAVSFTLAPGATQYVAFDSNSQGACACGEGDSLPTDAYGGFTSAWAEFDFGNTSNDDWSGADASCLVAEAAGQQCPGLNVCHNGQCSTINADGSGVNAYTQGMENEDGIGLNIPPGSNIMLEITAAYSG